MLDIKRIREQPEEVKVGVRKKKGDPALVDRLLLLDEERRQLRFATEQQQAELNKRSQGMGSVTTEEREKLRLELKQLSDQIKAQREQLQSIDEQYLVLLRQVPNIPADDVPEGASEADNVVVREVGDKPHFDFVPKDHEELAKSLDLLDMERGAKVSGAKFYYLKNELVLLEQAVLRFALDHLYRKGFVPLVVPDLVHPTAMYGAGHFVTPEDERDGDAYIVERDGLCLAGTAEVGLANYHAEEILNEGELPLRYCGYSACFRREAGTYGKEARGLYRVHQFHKVEMFSYTRPEDSTGEHALLLGIAEELLEKLELPYRVVLNCGGDLGHPQAKKWDIETWMAGLGKYGETHSCSNDTDYQARSLNVRFRRSGGGKEKEIEYVHTLNNTAFASPRILIPLLENNQQADGSILIPEVLIPYTGFDRIEQK